MADALCGWASEKKEHWSDMENEKKSLSVLRLGLPEFLQK